MNGFGEGSAPAATSFENHLECIARHMTVEMVMTPRRDWVSAAPTDLLTTAKERLGNRFDQLPVLDGDRVVGLLVAKDIEAADLNAIVAQHMEALCNLATVKTSDSFEAAICHLARTPCVFVCDPSNGEVSGLLHFSDLNKHAVRVFFYLWLSALEMGLAALVKQKCPRFEDWGKHLKENEERLVMILGRYELARRNGIDLSPVEGMELSDLLKITNKTPGLFGLLKLTKSRWDKMTGPLVKLRHAAMHPVRSLVQSHEAVEKLLSRLCDLKKLVALLSAPEEKGEPRNENGERGSSV